VRFTLGLAAQAALTLGFAVPFYWAFDALFRGRLVGQLHLQIPCALVWGFVAMGIVSTVYIGVRFGAEAARTSKAFWEL
jgi:hypothetical protein